ncbi:MAG: glycine cleavage system aminomethyltransferase GcvT [Clostridiales bacterium]|nr:glycine cleavage system aminomethyltransferase GcvT [Clostridiales bacterium]
MERKTPLFGRHKALGCAFTSFAGYMLPVQYTGIAEEHMAVRKNAGLFDVSHMGELFLCGGDALRNLNIILTNDFTSMADGAVRYSLICNEHGGIEDDLTVFRISKDRFLIVPNAANRIKVFELIASHIQGDVIIKDESDDYALLALQGPKSHGILSKLTDAASIPAKNYSFINEASLAGAPCIISRTGYTGEVGYEVFCSPEDAPGLWDVLLQEGGKDGLVPCGLGARDTLRIEAAMPLYGCEIDGETTPFEAGLAFAVKMSKPEFIGKAALEGKRAPGRVRVGLKAVGKGIARGGCPVFRDKKLVGATTSGTYLPYLAGAYAMAYVSISDAACGAAVDVETRGRMILHEIVPLPFYSRSPVENDSA